MKYWDLVISLPKSKRRGSEVGAATVEMAFLTPLILLMVMGVVDFARVYYDAIIVTHAARAAVAYGAQSNATSRDFAGIQFAAQQEAQDLVRHDASAGISVTTEQFCRCPSGTVVDCITGNCGIGSAPEIYLRVTAEKIFKLLIPYPGIPNPIILRRQAVLRVQ